MSRIITENDLSAIAKNPSIVLNFFNLENVADILEDIESPEMMSPSDVIVKVAYLAEIDRKIDGDDYGFGDGKAFLAAVKSIESSGWNSITNTEAQILGASIARWLNEKNHSVMHYWTHHSIHRISAHFISEVERGLGGESKVLSVLTSLEKNLEKSSAAAILDPLSSGLLGDVGENFDTDVILLNGLGAFKSNYFLNSVTEKLFAESAQGMPALKTITYIYCKNVEIDQRVMASLEDAISSSGYDSDVFLVSLFKEAMSNAVARNPSRYEQGLDRPSALISDIIHYIKEDIIGDEGVRKKLAKHIDNEDAYKFLKERILIDMDSAFSKRDLGAAAKKAALSDDLSL